MSAPPRLTAGGPHYYTLAPESAVGGEVYERELLARLPAHGIDLILGLPRDHRFTRRPAGARVQVLRHGLGLHWTRAPLIFAPYALGLLLRHRVDLLRGHSVRHTGPALLLARALARSRVPVVLHHHHLDPRWARLEAAIARRADLVVAVSEHARAALVAAGVDAARVRVAPQGLTAPPDAAAAGGNGAPTAAAAATDNAAAAAADTAAWPAGGLRLLHLGRLEPRKRPDLALETLVALVADGVDAALVVAGDGPLAPALADRARAAGVADRLAFPGRVDDAEKWRLYDGADVLLFGSTLEGFGLVVAEAQSRGLPVVAAAGTATAEAFDPGRSGLLVPPQAGAFAAAVRELADPERRAAMGAHARAFARRFDWDVCAAAVADVYREAVGR